MAIPGSGNRSGSALVPAPRFEFQHLLPFLQPGMYRLDGDASILYKFVQHVRDTPTPPVCVAVLMRVLGHTSPFVIEKNERDAITVYHTDSLALQDDGVASDELRKIVQELAKMGATVYSHGFEAAPGVIRRQDDDYSCTVFSLIDSLALLRLGNRETIRKLSRETKSPWIYTVDAIPCKLDVQAAHAALYDQYLDASLGDGAERELTLKTFIGHQLEDELRELSEEQESLPETPGVQPA